MKLDSETETLKAWCHWKRKEKDAHPDDVAFAMAIESVINKNKRLRETLTSIIIHGQHPGYDNNWAVYVLDLAKSALEGK